MFQKRDDEPCPHAVAGTQRPGMAAERPTNTRAVLARAATGGELPHPPTKRRDVPTRWRAQAACLRGRNRARGLLPEREGASCGRSRAEEPCHG